MTHLLNTDAWDPTCRALGIQVAQVAPGWARLRMRVTRAMVNGHGTAHGGYLFLLADAAFAYASNAGGPVAVAQSAQIAYLRPAAVGAALLAEATERARLGRFGVYDVTVRREGGPSVAEFRGHSVLLTGPPHLATTASAAAAATDSHPSEGKSG